jgi:hypothetical protein
MKITCQQCSEVHVVEVVFKDWSDWRSGKLAQDAFPYLSADERELLISGVCGKCFEEMFPPDE